MRWRAVCQVGSQARSSRFIVAFEEKNVERRTLVGVDHEGAGTTMKPVSSPRSSLSLSLSPHLLQNTRGHREASPSKYAHVSNVHFNHRSHRPSRAIAPSPLSFFLFFFLSFSPLISLFLRREPFIRRAIPFRATYPSHSHQPTAWKRPIRSFVSLLLFFYSSLRVYTFLGCNDSCGVSNSFLAWNTARTRL